MKLFSSIKFEISILYTAILGLILIAFSGVFYVISNTILQQADQQLKIKAEAVDLTLKSYLRALGNKEENLPEAVDKTMSMRNESFLEYKSWKVSQKWWRQSQSLNLSKDYINVVTTKGGHVFSSSNFPINLRDLFLSNIQTPLGQVMFWTLKEGHTSIRVINYPVAQRVVGRYLIQIGMPQSPLTQELRNWLYSIALSVPLVLLLTNFVGRLLANRLLQPVYEITDLAKRITKEDLSARIKSKHFDREMGSLIESFNDMIARLEKSFKHIEQFSYHVAHELKTPLTIIQGEANLLLRRDRSVHEYKQALQIILEESQRVLKTVDDLLLLTKLGYQHEVFKFERFDFVEFLNEIIEQNRLMAANKGLGIRMDLKGINPPLVISGDRFHMRRLFFNIIGNAIKVTPEGGCVELRVEERNGQIISSISDAGPGISPENLERIFEEFTSANPISGLGLNIAYTIAKLHQGDIQVESQMGRGTTFRIILPSTLTESLLAN